MMPLAVGKIKFQLEHLDCTQWLQDLKHYKTTTRQIA
jgi:hypothetical protein